MAVPSEFSRHGDHESASQPASLSVWCDGEQTDDRRVGRISWQTTTRFRRKHEPDDSAGEILGHDPAFCAVELWSSPFGYSGDCHTVARGARLDPQQNALGRVTRFGIAEHEFVRTTRLSHTLEYPIRIGDRIIADRYRKVRPQLLCGGSKVWRRILCLSGSIVWASGRPDSSLDESQRCNSGRPSVSDRKNIRYLGTSVSTCQDQIVNKHRQPIAHVYTDRASVWERTVGFANASEAEQVTALAHLHFVKEATQPGRFGPTFSASIASVAVVILLFFSVTQTLGVQIAAMRSEFLAIADKALESGNAGVLDAALENASAAGPSTAGTQLATVAGVSLLMLAVCAVVLAWLNDRRRAIAAMWMETFNDVSTRAARNESSRVDDAPRRAVIGPLTTNAPVISEVDVVDVVVDDVRVGDENVVTGRPNRFEGCSGD